MFYTHLTHLQQSFVQASTPPQKVDLQTYSEKAYQDDHHGTRSYYFFAWNPLAQRIPID